MDKTKRLTVAEFRALMDAEKQPDASANKYHAQRTHGYASMKEYGRAQTLKMLQNEGVVIDLQEQVTFELLPEQRDKRGKLVERPVRYIADFVYKDPKGNIIVEDTKGMKTKDYIIKRKMMLYFHGIRIKEV